MTSLDLRALPRIALAVLLLTLLLGPRGAAADGMGRHPKIEHGLLTCLGATPIPADVLPQAGLRLEAGSVLAVVEHDGTVSDLAAGLKKLGVQPVQAYGDLILAWIPVDRLGEVTELPGVRYLRRPYVPVPLLGEGSRLVSEGVTLLGASRFHARGVLGQGVRIAVIDVGFASLTQAQRAGEIAPGAIKWTRDYTGRGLESSSPHGTAVAQVVHNMAPQAQLYLAAVGNEVDLACAVQDCISLGVDIIVHSVGWVNTNFGDGTGVVADIVRMATSAGILWINAAGNHAERHWLGIPKIRPDGWLEYEPGVLDLELVVEIPGLVQVALTWNEWPRAVSDLDLYLLDAEGAVVVSSQSEQSGYAPPTEFISYFAERGRYTVRVHARQASGPVAVRILSLNHGLQPYVPRSSILAPGDARETFTVGAMGLKNWVTGPQQPYSSQGPTTDGRLKPDLTALDGVTNFVFPTFYGTSAAAPHVAGAAALLLSQARLRGETLTSVELQELLLRWAVDMGEPGPDPVYGHGRLRFYVDQVYAERVVLSLPGGVASPGETITVQVTVRMPPTQVGGVELRETLPAGLVGRIEEHGGADSTEQGSDLVWRWTLLLPGQERRVRYRVTIPPDYPPGQYTLLGRANHDPVTGDSTLRVVDLVRAERISILCVPNPVRSGQTVRFTVQGVEAWEVRLRVYDLAGRLVHDSGWQPGPTYQWNLQDDRGRMVASGVYLYWVEVRNFEGRVVRSGVERLLVVR